MIWLQWKSLMEVMEEERDAEYEYDSEDDGTPMIGLGSTRRQV